MAEVRWFRHSEESARMPLKETGPTIIGRDPGCDIEVPDPAVSRRHCSIEKIGEIWLLKDLTGSGVEVDGDRVQEKELWEGAEVSLGAMRFVFSMAARAAPSAVTLRNRGGETAPGREPVPPRVELAQLHIVEPGGERSVPFSGDMTIGSGEGCSVRLNDEGVSRQHVRIKKDGWGFVVCDQRSSYGTWIGELQIFEAAIPPGCTVRVGNSELTLRVPEEQEPFEGIVGEAPAMRKVYETIERVASTNAIVTILGETGTGKELVARAIHARSVRADKRFVPVNCGALSKELLESELFGHERGAFTGATRAHRGAFGEADGGTLFFDEIGELPLVSQAKLLRALETGEIKRVGSAVPTHVDVRIIAATNRDLRAEVQRGLFREDLYWRLQVVPIVLPALRDRKGDIGALIRHFLELHKPEGPLRLTAEAEQLLREHDWPGNVRELGNTLWRSLMLHRRDARVIDARDIVLERHCPTLAKGVGLHDPDEEDIERVFIVGKTLRAIEEEAVRKSFRRLGENVSRVAIALGQARSTIRRTLERLGLNAPDDEK